MASSSPGRRNFYGLEAAFERAVLFDGLAIFRGSRRADALNFAAAQRWFQNIGGIERAFRRTRADESVQFVDEHNRVLALHQFLHDGLQPLFELPAIFRARDDQRKIERKNSLVREKRRHVAIGNPLRQAFHDRCLSHARLADQNGIILRPAAQDLDGAFEFAISPNERIELAFHRRLRKIAAEFR